MDKKVRCELVGKEHAYPAFLDLVIKGITGKGAVVARYVVESEHLSPGQAIPNGNYLRTPHPYAAKEARVRIQYGRMYAGWSTST